jgi:hypothetical protein
VGALQRAAADVSLVVPAPPHGMLRLIGEAAETGTYDNLDQTVRVFNPGPGDIDLQARIVTPDGSFVLDTLTEVVGEFSPIDHVSLDEDESVEISLLSTSDVGAGINVFADFSDIPSYNIGRKRTFVESFVDFIDVIPSPRSAQMHVPLGSSSEVVGSFAAVPVGGAASAIEFRLIDVDGTPLVSGTPEIVSATAANENLSSVLLHLNGGQRFQARLAEGATGPAMFFGRWLIVGAPSRDA